MLFYWLTVLWSKIVWLFRPVTPADVARIDPNSPCPACGHRKGKIQTKHITKPQTGGGIPENVVAVEHECALCGALWYEEPVVKLTTKTVQPGSRKQATLPAVAKAE